MLTLVTAAVWLEFTAFGSAVAVAAFLTRPIERLLNGSAKPVAMVLPPGLAIDGTDDIA
jgi:hypothetical protein